MERMIEGIIMPLEELSLHMYPLSLSLSLSLFLSLSG